MVTRTSLLIVGLLACLHRTFVAGFISNKRYLSRLRTKSLKSFKTFKNLNRIPDNHIVNALDRFSGKVTAADVASKAGIPLNDAKVGLVQLSALLVDDVATSLEVDSQGELIFHFPQNLRKSLRRRDKLFRWRERWQKSSAIILNTTKIVFGIVLVFSTVAVWSLVLAIAVANSTSRNEDNRHGKKNTDKNQQRQSSDQSMSFSFSTSRPVIDVIDTLRLLVNINNGNGLTRKTSAPSGRLASIFSYVFGERDPNQDLEQRQLAAAAKAIRFYGGVVVAEQLAPYFNSPHLTSDHPSEQWMMPILVALDGIPVVTNDGDIVYKFEKLLSTTTMNKDTCSHKKSFPTFSSKNSFVENIKSNIQHWLNDLQTKNRNEDINQIPLPIMENIIPFSNAPISDQMFAAGLGLIHFLGVSVLGFQMFSTPHNFISVSCFIQFAFFSCLINILPMIRKYNVFIKNKQIKKRNKNRQDWYRLLTTTTTTHSLSNTQLKLKETLNRKLAGLNEISDLINKEFLENEAEVIFSTQENEVVNNLKKQKQVELESFDMRLAAQA